VIIASLPRLTAQQFPVAPELVEGYLAIELRCSRISQYRAGSVCCRDQAVALPIRMGGEAVSAARDLIKTSVCP